MVLKPIFAFNVRAVVFFSWNRWPFGIKITLSPKHEALIDDNNGTDDDTDDENDDYTHDINQSATERRARHRAWSKVYLL